jgi:hypothetical protein
VGIVTGSHFFQRLLALVFRTAIHHYFGALGQKPFSDAAAYAPGSAGDDDHLTFVRFDGLLQIGIIQTLTGCPKSTLKTIMIV